MEPGAAIGRKWFRPMIYLFYPEVNLTGLILGGTILSLVLTFVLLKFCSNLLPRDAGRVYAHEGALSAGKPRGAGLVFILVFIAVTLLFLPLDLERLINLVLLLAAMVTGYLDDKARHPWGDLKKGLLDLGLSLGVALNVFIARGSTIMLPFSQNTADLPSVVFILLASLLVWVSINVTNCTDGVDGLSGTLVLITLATIALAAGNYQATLFGESSWIYLLAGTLVAYLWFNATPSLLIMGDAGSRALGLFISIVVLQTGQPLLYIPAAALLIIDGGPGLVKVSLLRFLKIHIMKNIRTPIHDHVRKNLGWSNTQTVFRFALIQLVISFILLAALRLIG